MSMQSASYNEFRGACASNDPGAYTQLSVTESLGDLAYASREHIKDIDDLYGLPQKERNHTRGAVGQGGRRQQRLPESSYQDGQESIGVGRVPDLLYRGSGRAGYWVNMTTLEFVFMGERFSIGFAYKTVDKCRGVMCHIDRFDAGEWKKVSQGWSRCVPQDPFVKETGRKLALRRATAKTGWLTLEKLPPESRPATHHWVSTFPGGWDRKAWNTAAWACYMGRRGKAVGT